MPKRPPLLPPLQEKEPDKARKKVLRCSLRTNICIFMCSTPVRCCPGQRHACFRRPRCHMRDVVAAVVVVAAAAVVVHDRSALCGGGSTSFNYTADCTRSSPILSRSRSRGCLRGCPEDMISHAEFWHGLAFQLFDLIPQPQL